MVWTLADATRALASQLHIANGSTHCVPTDFARRNAVWRSDLRAALDTTPADAVTDAFVPCAGADVLSPLADECGASHRSLGLRYAEGDSLGA